MYMILYLIIYFVLIVCVYVFSYRYLKKKNERLIIGWECCLGEFYNYILICIIFKFVLLIL